MLEFIKDDTSSFGAKPSEGTMKFGKRFRIKISIFMPEWESVCLLYKDLKKLLNQIDPAKRDEGFRQFLKNEIEKMNEFFSGKEEEYRKRFQELKDEVAELSSGEDPIHVIMDLLQFHNQLVLLLHYYVLNCDGFMKIIKKHRKKTGGEFSLSFMQGDNQQLVFIKNSLDNLLAEWGETLRQLSQELKTVSYHKLYDILKQHQNEVNEIRAERIARTANPLALVAQQQPVYHPQTHPTHYTQNSLTRLQQAATRNRGKAIVNSSQPIYDQEPSMVAEDDEMSKDREIDKLMALISLSFKKIYKPTNNNLRTSSNTSRANQDHSLRINRSTGYENQRIGNVAGARETVEQSDWRDDTDDDELEDQKLEAHYMYMAQIQEVSQDVADSGPIFDSVLVQKVSNDDHYNVFAIESEHPEQSASVHNTYPIEQDEHIVIIDSLDMSCDREQIDQNDDDNDLANEHKELDKVITLENKVKVLDNIVYKTGQSVQTMNMLNNKCRTSFAKPEFLKKAQRANPRLLKKTKKRTKSDQNRTKNGKRVIPTTSVGRPQLKSNPMEDRVMLNNSKRKKQEVEDQRRNVKLSKNKTSVTACNDSLNAKTLNVNFVCATCSNCVLNDKHDMCVLKSVAKPIRKTVALEFNQKPINSTRKLNERISKACSWWYLKFTPSGYKWKPKSGKENVNPNLVEIVPFIVDSGCSEHMTGNLKLLINFVEKFLGTVKFRNDQIAPILGYGDLVQGAVTIKRVYYVEGLNHSLFSVGQFCDADLEVAFRKSTCYIRDLKGNDLLTCSRGTNLYSITLQVTNSPNPICLMAKATSSQAWSKDETPEVLIDFLRLVQRGLHAQVRIVQTDKGTEFLNKTLHAYFASEGILHQTSVARTPEQNDVVEKRKRTLVEAARTMLSAAKVPLFFWAEAITTSCFTQNHSLVIPRHEKTPYHIINEQTPSVKFFHIFGSLCYIVRDGENLDKMKEKGDACIFVGYSTQSRAYKVFNKRTIVIVETIHVNFDELPQMASDDVSSGPVPKCPTMALEHNSLSPGLQCQDNVTQADRTVKTSNEQDLLFSPMFDELLNGSSQVVSKSSALTTADALNQRQQHHTTPLNTQITTDHTYHPLEQVIGNPSQSVRTRRQLESDDEMCMFALTEELHHFDRLDVWELVDRPLCKNVINMKWLWKNKRDEENTVIRNKSHLVMDVKTSFLYGPLKEEVHVNQPDGFVELSNFLVSKGFSKGIQINQSPHGIFINQAKYAQEILVKHGVTSCDSVGTPMATKHLDADLSGTPVDQTKYHSMVGALMYLTAMVKRIFRYLKDTIHMGLWYSNDTGFELTSFSYSDHTGCLDSRKSTSGGIQFLGGDKLVSWSSKKQDCTSMSSAEAEYVSLSVCCAQVLWMRTQLTDYGFHFDKIPMYCDQKQPWPSRAIWSSIRVPSTSTSDITS
nr:retrotransposon protein, putative, unclassified [Tanacetum cinerariifolium]